MEILKESDKIIIKSIGLYDSDVSSYSDIIYYKSIGTLKLEVNIYDSETNSLLDTLYIDATNINFNSCVYFNDDTTEISINTERLLRRYGYATGNFKVTYKFYIDILGDQSESNRSIIDTISPSRKEISIKYVFFNEGTISTFKEFSNKYFNQFSENFQFDKFLNFGNNKIFVILNSKNEFSNQNSLHTIILKLYEELPVEFEVNSSLWITKTFSEEFEDIITLFPPETLDLENVNILKPADFSIKGMEKSYLPYKNYSDFTSESELYNFNNEILSKINKSDLYGIDINVDYSNFKNFVHFGSAANIVSNFKEKISNIKYYETKSNTVKQSYSDSSSQYYKLKNDEIIQELTKYERFLYYTTGSYYTSSIAYSAETHSVSPYTLFSRPDSSLEKLLIDSTWPKSGTVSGSGYPYILCSPNDITGSTWYDLVLTDALNYDLENRDYLINTVPEYIRNDVDENIDYITLINMIGEFYDNIWIYINNYYSILKREHKLKDTLPNDLIWNILKSFGFDMNNSKDLVNLSNYLLGAYPTGSGSYTINVKNAQKNINTEIWNRILNNIPYILKSKGTKKSIESLLNCYGIPKDSILIKEFGGPSKLSGSFTTEENQSYSYEVTDFSYVLNMSGSQMLSIPWITSSYDNQVPSSIELKFKTVHTASQLLIEKSGSGDTNFNFYLKLVHSYGDRGYIEFSIPTGSYSITTPTYSLFDGKYYYICIVRNEDTETLLPISDSSNTTYKLYLKYFDEDSKNTYINYSSSFTVTGSKPYSNSAYNNSGSLYIGGNIQSDNLIGKIDEIKLWAESLSENVIDWHSKYSIATNGNTLTSSLNTLLFRLSFNTPFDVGTTPRFLNEAYNSSSYINSASAVGFATMSSYPYNFSWYERTHLIENNFISPSMITSDKIRIQDNSISQRIMLPDNYIVTPLRFPANSMYKNLIYDKSSSVWVNIEGEKITSHAEQKESDKIFIGFSPSQYINNDMLAYFGNNNILSFLGDPAYKYENEYPSVFTLNNSYWKNSKTSVRFDDFIKYIRLYDKNIFEQIKKLIPANTFSIIGTEIESSIIHRSRIKLINRENAQNLDSGIGTIDIDSNIPINGSYMLLKSNLKAIKNININSMQIIKHGIHKIMYQSPIANVFNKMNAKILVPRDNIAAKSVLSNASMAIKFKPLYGEKYIKNATILYSLNRWLLNQTTNAAFVKCRVISPGEFIKRNTITNSGTTIDGSQAVQITRNVSKQLKVNYSNNPKLIVE